MNKILTFLIFLFSGTCLMGQISESEPNNSFKTSDYFGKDITVSGTLDASTDVYDHFVSKLPSDGTVEIIVSATNTGSGSGYLYFIGYDGRELNGQIIADYIGTTIGAGLSVYDTIRLYGQRSDSFYLRFQVQGNFTYNFRYQITDTSASDSEPDNDFNSAFLLSQLVKKEGHVHYTNKGSTDNYDYYKLALKADGTLKIFLEGTNVGGGTGYMYLSFYDGRGVNGQFYADYIEGGGSIKYKQTVFDTFSFYGRGKDSIYIRIESSKAFQYSIKYELRDTGNNDIEPNNSFNEATSIGIRQLKMGHVGYLSNGATDYYDYYKAVFASDGTLKIVTSGTNIGNASAYLYLSGYDSRPVNGNVVSKYISKNGNIPAGTKFTDTITLSGRAMDTFYFRFESSGPFMYSILYDLIDLSPNDIEPNNDFKNATHINHREVKQGHVVYTGAGITDYYDFYKTKLHTDGTVKIYITGKNVSGTNSYLYLSTYDSRKINGSVSAKYIGNTGSIPNGAIVNDTILIYGRAVDSFYMKLEGSGAFSYSISYEITDSSINDIEANNTFNSALNLPVLQKLNGHINYIAAGVVDNHDFYRVVNSADGTIQVILKIKNQGVSSGYFYVSGYDNRRSNGQVFAKYVGNTGSIQAGSQITDTLNLYCIARDTFFFRIESSQPFSYELEYRLQNTSPNDVESNNTFETSIPVKLSELKSGHIGYIKNGLTDNSDFYKAVVPVNGSIRVIMDVTNTSNNNGYVFIYGYDKRKVNGNILAKYIRNTGSIKPGQRMKDTLFVNCMISDTFYLNITSSQCFKYTMRLDFIDRYPHANTENERIGNTVGFRPQFHNANNFIWDFGDGTKSTLMYPMKTYKPGLYVTKLIVTNTFCNFKDTATETIEVKGIEYYTPDSGGTGGDVIMNIYGGGLDTATIVKLVKGGVEIFPIRKFTTINKMQLKAVFDLHLANEGLYDLQITIPGQPLITYKNGFRINPFRYPYTWSQVVAPSRWRTNVDNKFKLLVGNRGNVNAAGVLVTLIWPKTVKLTFDTKWFKPPSSGTYQLKLADTVYNFNWADIKHFYNDTFNTITSIDTFNGKPYNGYMRLIMIPKIGPGGTFEIPLTARSSSSGEQNFITYTFKPNIYGSCPGGSWMDASENLAVASIDGIDRLVSLSPVLEKSPVGWLTKATKGTTTHMANLGQAMGAFYNYATGVTNSIDESLPADYYQNVDAGNAQVGQAILDVAVDKMVDKGVDGMMKGQTDNLNNYIAKNPNASASSFEFAIDNLNDINDIRQKVRDMYKNAKDLKDLYSKLQRLEQLAKDCPELQKQLKDLKDQIGKDMNLQDPNETKTNSVTSMDPNAIYGPVGQGANGVYVNNFARQNFMITYENVDTAEASAQIVRIVDTLDKTKFDLSTFELTGYSIGLRSFSIPAGRKEFVGEDSVSPQMRVRVNAELNMNTGIVTWQFTSIDRITRDLPVFEGFLPPNVLKPEGEGSVSYTIQPFSSLGDGATLRNRAMIYFDGNDPISTNTWTNIIDILPPSSSVKAIKGKGIAQIELTFSGSDANSGIGFYNLYVKEGNGPWLAFSGTSSDTMSLVGQYGKVYSFCSVARDRVGNTEQKTLVAETVIGIGVSAGSGNNLLIYPNPVKDLLFMDNLGKYTSFTITDISGKVVLNGNLNQNSVNINMSNLYSGLYIITVRNDKEQSSMKVMKF